MVTRDFNDAHTLENTDNSANGLGLTLFMFACIEVLRCVCVCVVLCLVGNKYPHSQQPPCGKQRNKHTK